MSDYYGFRPYVPVAKRRMLAARELEKLKKKGHIVSPVVIEGRTIARNFWGKAWCESWSVIPTTRTVYRAADRMCVTVRSSI